MVAGFDLSAVQAVGLDETASEGGHNYVTVFIDMQRQEKPMLFVQHFFAYAQVVFAILYRHTVYRQVAAPR